MQLNHSKRIFLAGASGAIGRRLCLLLAADGHHVTGTTRTSEKTALLESLDVRPVVVDVFDTEALHAAVREARAEVVIHQLTDLPLGLESTKMAEARARTARLRMTGTKNLVAAAVAARVERFIAQSIAFAYAPGPKPFDESAPLNIAAPDEGAAVSAQAVASLEEQVLSGPFVDIVLRYGRLYGPETGIDTPPAGGPLHVDAAADAARLAVLEGKAGIYNFAETDGAVTSLQARVHFGWTPDFRLN